MPRSPTLAARLPDPAPPLPPFAEGRLQLEFVRAGEQTVLYPRVQTPPLRVIRAFPIEHGGALVHLHNLSGGVLGGDQLDLAVTVGEGARAQLTTTGATRVYRHRAGLPDATQHSRFVVGRDALLEYLPDPLIPFANSRYHQSTQITLAEGAGLFCWEVIAPGRAARGERFAYERLQLELAISAPDRPLALERMRLEPAQRSLASLARLGPYEYFATFYACRVGVPAERWLALEAQLDEMARALTQTGEVVWGTSTLPAHGLVVRGLSRTLPAIVAELPRFWASCRLALYGEVAHLPRKLF